MLRTSSLTKWPLWIAEAIRGPWPFIMVQVGVFIALILNNSEGGAVIEAVAKIPVNLMQVPVGKISTKRSQNAA